MPQMARQNATRSRIRIAAIIATLVALACLHMVTPAYAQEKPVRLVVFGDSLTAGYQLAENRAFPAVLERALQKKGYKVQVRNASVSGDTASGGLARLDWALAETADAVIVELGANDMLRGIDPTQSEKALDGIIARIKKRGIKILLAGMKAAPGMGKSYETKFNAIYPALARKHGVMLYPFFLDGVAGVKELNLPDGIHPNARGVERIVERILPYAEKLIAATSRID